MPPFYPINLAFKRNLRIRASFVPHRKYSDLSFCTDLISFGPYFRTVVEPACEWISQLGSKSLLFDQYIRYWAQQSYKIISQARPISTLQTVIIY